MSKGVNKSTKNSKPFTFNRKVRDACLPVVKEPNLVAASTLPMIQKNETRPNYSTLGSKYGISFGAAKRSINMNRSIRPLNRAEYF